MTPVWLALFILSLLVFCASFAWVLMLAYRESTTWGLVSTFVPFGAFVFAVKFWAESKRAVIPCVAAMLLATVTGLGYSVSKVNTNLGVDGGADLWADSSGFEAMAATDSTGFDTTDDNFGPTTDEGTETGNLTAQNPGSVNMENTAAPAQQPESNSALDQLEISEKKAGKEVPTQHPRRGRRHSTVPLDKLPELKGERAALILKDGERVFGVIEQVGTEKVVVRKIVGGGSILFTLRRVDIAEIQTRHWR